MSDLQENRIKYRVLVDGRVLNESSTQSMADVFVSGLSEDMRNKAIVVPVVEDGRQLLFS